MRAAAPRSAQGGAATLGGMSSRAVPAPGPSGASRAVLLALACVLAACVVLVQAPRASAHTDLEAASPARGDRVELAPFRVTLVFTEDITPQSVQVVVRGPDGTPAQGAVTVRDATVTVPVLTTAAGRYVVAYRVSSVDGHPVTGRYAYAVTGEPERAGPVAADTAAPPTADAVASPSGTGWWWLLVLAPALVARAVQRSWSHRARR